MVLSAFGGYDARAMDDLAGAEREAVARVVCGSCGNETPVGKACAVCGKPLPRSGDQMRVMALVAIAVAIAIVGVAASILLAVGLDAGGG